LSERERHVCAEEAPPFTYRLLDPKISLFRLKRPKKIQINFGMESRAGIFWPPLAKGGAKV
jgi:hypothetical protein